MFYPSDSTPFYLGREQWGGRLWTCPLSVASTRYFTHIYQCFGSEVTDSGHFAESGSGSRVLQNPDPDKGFLSFFFKTRYICFLNPHKGHSASSLTVFYHEISSFFPYMGAIYLLGSGSGSESGSMDPFESGLIRIRNTEKNYAFLNENLESHS